MKYQLEITTQFKRDSKLIQRQNRESKKLSDLVTLLLNGEKLDSKYRNHSLKGEYAKHRECHLEPDWLLIYRIKDEKLILVRTGSHSELFE